MNALSPSPQEVPAAETGHIKPDPFISFQSSPGHLRAAAYLYGLTTVPLAGARILELGCGHAGNLLPFALAYPGATVVGVDPDAAAVQAGQRAAQKVGAANLRIVHAEFSAIDASLGEFDYIVANDVYSSLEPAAAAELLRICRMNLAFEGVAYVSYDTYPGAKAAEGVRDAVLLHMHGAADVDDQIASARTALTLFTEGAPLSAQWSAASAAAARKMEAMLEGNPGTLQFVAPRYPAHYVEFIDTADRFSMICVGDAEPQAEMASAYGNNVSLVNSLVALGRPKALRQQYLDFSVGRTQRRALLAHREREQAILPVPDLKRLRELRWAGGFQRIAASAHDETKATYLTHSDRSFSTDDPVLQAVIDQMEHAWPGSVPVDAFVDIVRARKLASEGASAEDAVFESLKYLFERGIGRYTLEDGPYDQACDGRVSLVQGTDSLAVAALSTEAPVPGGFNLWHEGVSLVLTPEEAKAIVSLGKGVALAEVWALAENHDSTPPMGGSSRGSAVTRAKLEPVGHLLRKLHRSALFRADADSWRTWLEAGLESTGGQGPFWTLYLHALARAGADRGAAQPLAHKLPRQQAQAGAAALKEAQELLRLALNKAGGPEVETRTRRLVKQAPYVAAGWDALAAIERHNANPEGSLEMFRRSLKLEGSSPERLLSMAATFRSIGALADAEACCLRAIEMKPDYDLAFNFMGTCQRLGSRLHEAMQSFRRALEIDPAYVEARSNLAVTLADLADFSDANYQVRKFIAPTSRDTGLLQSRFFGLNYSPDLSPDEIAQALRKYGSIVEQPLRAEWKPHPNHRDPGRKLRIGYVSPDLRSHPVRLFLEPLLAHHDKVRFEVHAYAELEREDEGTAALKPYFDHWTVTSGLSSEVLARRIRADKIDVLVDLAGHTANNRLGVFARKAAPVQVTWLGFGGSTGLSSMDYILMDEDMAPAGSDPLFTEKIWRVADSNFAFRPGKAMGEVSSLPALSNGHVRFLTLSRAIRFNHRVVRVWAEILRRIPNARLVVNSHNYRSARVCDDLRQKFMAHRIDPERLVLEYRSPPWDSFREADISLDCFPHNSGTTLFESLYMGLPVITLPDRPGVGRIGASTLNGLGRREWIADSEEDYISKVIALASDLPALARLRAGLREEMQRSALMDEAGFARKVENAFREMFKIWCEGQT